MLGRTLSHYRILEKIGAGGMGVVFRAQDAQLERAVALKVVGEQAQVDQNARERLLREARTASALNHPNICTIYEAGVADGETYIAMELVEGQPLSAMISGDGLPVEVAIRYGVQIADALAHAHERGVVHRDLKSANVIVTPEGRPKVLDFGLAKRVIEAPGEATRSEPLTEAGAVSGTLSYMAPEVLRGEPADPRSDLWALGVMLYQAVTGSLPFQGPTGFQISSAILRDSAAPLPAHVPPGLAGIIQRLLAKQPGERYQRAGEVRAALEAIQPGVAASGAVPVVRVSRRRWIWVAGPVAITAAVLWVSIDRRSKPPAPAGGPRLSDGSRPSTNREANEYYERSLLFGGAGARQDIPQERRMLERALAVDPKFAAARAEYAFTHVIMILRGNSNDASWLYKAEDEIRKALQDDPGCGRAHSVLAIIHLLRGRKELVPGEVDRTLQTNPGDATAYSWLIFYHQINGDYAQAVQTAKQSIARWPLYWPGHAALGDLLREQGDTAGAIREEERILEQDPHNLQGLTFLAHAYLASGDLPKARQTLQRARGEDRKNYRLRQYWALLLAMEGKRAEALVEMDGEVEAYAGVYFRGPLLAAEFYAVMGDTAKALEWLDRAVRLGDDREDWLRRDPLLASVRDHPRFQQILASVAYRRAQRPRAGSESR
ncbi:MAG: protein kinase [Acidobacteria bacterium]|nr:protein kinase [Acidobacteriota bacterium]